MYCIARVSSFQISCLRRNKFVISHHRQCKRHVAARHGGLHESAEAHAEDGERAEHRPAAPALVFGLWLFGILVLVLGISRVAPVTPGESRRLVDWAYLGFLFRHVNPYLFTAMGISSSIGLSVLGAAWCVPPTIAPASPPTLDAQIHRESSAVFLKLQFANIHPSSSFVSRPAGESSSRGARSRAGRFAPRASPARTSYPSSSAKPSPSTASSWPSSCKPRSSTCPETQTDLTLNRS